MSAGHAGAPTFMNSQDLWLPAHDLQKIRPVISLEAGARAPPPVTEELLIADGFWGGEKQGRSGSC